MTPIPAAELLSRLPQDARHAVKSALGAAGKLPGAQKVVVFGRYAKGTQSPDSDLDVAVFFGDDGTPFISRHRALTRICVNPDIDIQAQAFSVSELDAPCGIVEEIVKYGIEYPGV